MWYIVFQWKGFFYQTPHPTLSAHGCKWNPWKSSTCSYFGSTTHQNDVEWKSTKALQELCRPLIARFMGPIWVLQDPGGPHVGPMNFAIGSHSVQAPLSSTNTFWMTIEKDSWSVGGLVHSRYVYNGADKIGRLVQERRNSSALAMELRLSCTNPLRYRRV